MQTFYFPRDCEKLEKLHADNSELYFLGYHYEYSGFKMINKIPQYGSKYKPGTWLQYRVVYPGEFEIVQQMESGQHVPRTISEIIY